MIGFTGPPCDAGTAWTADEAEVMAEHKWWSRVELMQTSKTVWPEDLLTVLGAVANLQR
jgi:hypothetical protein